RPLRTGYLLGGGIRRKRRLEEQHGLGPEASEDRGADELGPERVANQVKPGPRRVERAEHRHEQLPTQALAYLTRAPLHEPKGECVQRGQVRAAPLRTLAGLAHERVQFEFLLGAEWHFHLAERRDQLREQAGLPAQQLGETTERLRERRWTGSVSLPLP